MNWIGDAIQFIKDPSEAVQLVAVKQNIWSYAFIKSPSEAVKLYAKKQQSILYNMVGKKSKRSGQIIYAKKQQSIWNNIIRNKKINKSKTIIEDEKIEIDNLELAIVLLKIIKITQIHR